MLPSAALGAGELGRSARDRLSLAGDVEKPEPRSSRLPIGLGGVQMRASAPGLVLNVVDGSTTVSPGLAGS